MSGRRWTEDDEQFLADHIACWPIARIARQLGRTTKAVERYAERQGMFPTTTGEYLQSRDACRLLGRSPPDLARAARTGAIPAVRRSPLGWWLYDPEQLVGHDAWLRYIRGDDAGKDAAA